MSKYSLISIESRINTLINSNDICDEIYTLLKEMVRILILRKRLLTNPQEIDDISCEYAGDVYVKIINGFRVQYWVAYTSKCLMRYIISYRNTYYPVIIDASEDYELTQALINMNYSSSLSYKEEFDDLINKTYITSIIKIIKKSYNKNCRYIPGSCEFNNLYLSILLSLAKGKEVYYDLSPDLVEYLSIILMRVKMDIVRSIRDTASHNSECDIENIAKLMSFEENQ